ncbi:phosphotransferase [candidate division KSB1 bacterium]|nr:phosphotransferase [candidate division KSB1 bacterium]MBL7095601.1 phosphotransferase [candidate division KSB1 bacterium]
MERLSKIFKQKYGEAPDSIDVMRSDGSDRKIYRVFSGQQTVIGIIGDDPDENFAFVEFSKIFRKFGLRVPEIYIANLAEGVYLEEDLGDDTLFEWMTKIRESHGLTEEIKKMYLSVIKYLPNFQIKAGAKINYSLCYQHVIFGKHSMNWDLNYFKNRFLDVFYKNPVNDDAIEEDFRSLIEFLLQEDRNYFLYRDFQSRNVMIKNNLPYFIDYQSGRKGALQYDVASLLFDSKANLPQDFREEMVDVYLQEVQKFAKVNQNRFMKYFYGFVLMRIMQAFGAYGYLSHVKKKKHFLKSVPFAVNNLKILLDKNIDVFNSIPTLRKIFDKLVCDKNILTLGTEDE